MSFIIQGMKMPQHNAMHGDKDTIYRAAVRVRADGTADLIINYQGGYTFEENDLQRAPIVEIPTQHGRLVDADRMIAVMRSAAGDDETTVPLSAVQCMIENAPTVIESEEA